MTDVLWGFAAGSAVPVFLAYAAALMEWGEERNALLWAFRHGWTPDRLAAAQQAERLARRRIPLAPLNYVVRAWHAWRGESRALDEARHARREDAAVLTAPTGDLNAGVAPEPTLSGPSGLTAAPPRTGVRGL